MALTTCKECGKEVSAKADKCPNCGVAIKKKRGCLANIGIVFLLLIVIGVIGNLMSDKDKQASKPSKQEDMSPSTQDNNQQIATVDTKRIDLPKEQMDFISTVLSFTTKYKDADNELKKSAVRAERKAAISSKLKSLDIRDWIGDVKQMGTNSEGKAYIVVQLSDSNVAVKTWNNALSDIGSDTLIELNSNLFKSLSEMSKGTRIKFSGKFLKSDLDYVKEASLTEAGSMQNPEFIFKFSSATKY